MTSPLMVVAFDLGGVLVDVDHGRCMRLLGIDRPALERGFFDGGLHDELTVGAVDGDDYAAEVARRLGKDPAAVRAAWAGVVEVTTEGRALVEEVLATGARVHLWSNTDPIHLEKMAAQFRAAAAGERFSLATASFHLGAMKPHADYYERARALGEPVVFLDDLDKNVAGAVAAGVAARKCLGALEARAILVDAGVLGR